MQEHACIHGRVQTLLAGLLSWLLRHACCYGRATWTLTSMLVLFALLFHTTCSFAAAFDWGNTSSSTFEPAVYFNDTFGIPDDGSDTGTKYMRQPQLLNMAVNSWLKATVGTVHLPGRKRRNAA